MVAKPLTPITTVEFLFRFLNLCVETVAEAPKTIAPANPRQTTFIILILVSLLADWIELNTILTDRKDYVN